MYSSNSTGGSVTDACVTVFQADAPVEVTAGCVDSEGSFTIPVEPGTYKVRVRAAGFPDQWVYQSSTFERATPLEVSQFGSIVSILLLDGFADIVGRIVQSDGTPVENAKSPRTTSRPQPKGHRHERERRVRDRRPDAGRPGSRVHERSRLPVAFATKVLEDAAVFDLAAGDVRVVNDSLLPLSTVKVIMVDEKNHNRLKRAAFGSPIGPAAKRARTSTASSPSPVCPPATTR